MGCRREGRGDSCWALLAVQPLVPAERHLRAGAGEQTIRFSALRDIEAGEEVTTNYNGDPGNIKPLWFAALALTQAISRLQAMR